MQAVSDTYFRRIKKRYLLDGFSAREIAEELRVSLDAVYYFLRKHRIPRRSAREQNSVRFERKELSFDVKRNLSESEKNLFTAGILLYWCEGSKSVAQCTVDFANSDPSMLQLFIRFLRDIIRVDERRLRIQLYCFPNQSIEKLKEFWSKTLSVPKKQFTKPYVRKGAAMKYHTMQYGLAHIRYSDKKLLLYILSEIEKYKI